MKFKLPENHLLFFLGDGRYSLLGQPLQYNLSICPPLLHGQSTYTVHQVRVSTISLRTIRHPFSSRLLCLGHPPQPAGCTREITERMDKVGGALSHSSTHSSLPTPVPRGRVSLFLSGHLLANLTAGWGPQVGCCSLISQTYIGMQSSYPG